MDRVRSMALLTLVGGALTAVGSILPWATIASGIGSISKAGTEGDGIFTLAFGGVVILAGSLGLGGNRLALGAAALVGIVALIFVGSSIGNVNKAIAEIETGSISAQVGIGLWVAGLGAVLAIVGGLSGVRAKIPEVSLSPDDHGAKLAQLADLRDRGAITDAEYETKKAELLARM